MVQGYRSRWSPGLLPTTGAGRAFILLMTGEGIWTPSLTHPEAVPCLPEKGACFLSFYLECSASAA